MNFLSVCSTNGWMTVAADLSVVLPSAATLTHAHLMNSLCVAKEMAGTRVLFSFPLHSCGSVVKVTRFQRLTLSEFSNV